MRLLDTKTYRVCEQNEHTKRGEDPPPYAVLSHTWLPDLGEGVREVTYQDMQLSLLALMRGTFKKDGWVKLRAFCDRAARDGWQYAWMDTCCIDKDNPHDTQEAINAMFRWYRGAAVCYAYLADVPGQSPDTSPTPALFTSDLAFNQNYRREMVASQFQKSRWFTRGWTLQELLAPRQLSFLDQHWRYIGSRGNWEREITKTCLIAQSILRDFEPLCMVRSCIAQRLSWAAHRETTFEEDETYSLLGLFGVNMPLIYGEGRAKAFQRLQLELIKAYSDMSLFAWEERVLSINLPSNVACTRYKTGDLPYLPILSPSIKNFANAMNVQNIQNYVPRYTRFSMTNRGLIVEGNLWSFPTPESEGETGQEAEAHIMMLSCRDKVFFSKSDRLEDPLIGVCLARCGIQYFRIKMGLAYIDKARPGAPLAIGERPSSRSCMISSGMTEGERKKMGGHMFKAPLISLEYPEAPIDGPDKNMWDMSNFTIGSIPRWRGSEGWFVCPRIRVVIPGHIGNISSVTGGINTADGSFWIRERFVTRETDYDIILHSHALAFMSIRLAGSNNQILLVAVGMTSNLTTVMSSVLLDARVKFDIRKLLSYFPEQRCWLIQSMQDSQKTDRGTIFITLRPCPPEGTNPVVGEWDVKPDPLREYRLDVYM